MFETPNRYTGIIKALKLDGFRSGRHIVRDERGWRVEDIEVSYVWIATISPAFLRTYYLAAVQCHNGLYVLGGAESEEGLSSTCEVVPVVSRGCDPVKSYLQDNQLDLFAGDEALDGFGYSLSVRSLISSDLVFQNPRSPGMLGLAATLWSFAQELEKDFSELAELVAHGREMKLLPESI